MRVIMVGGGEILYYLPRQFAKKGHHVTIINMDHAEATGLSRRLKATVLVGDGSDPAVLEDAGARQADLVLALTPYDEDNLAICQIADRMFHVPRCASLINDPENEEVFRKLHVPVVFSATRIISTLIEEQAGFESIVGMFSLAEGKVSVSEVVLRHEEPACNMEVRGLELPEDVLIGGIIRQDRAVVPKGWTKMLAGDRLILIGYPESIEESIRRLKGKSP